MSRPPEIGFVYISQRGIFQDWSFCSPGKPGWMLLYLTLQESWCSGSSSQNCVLFPSQPKLEQEKYLVSTWPLKYKWVSSRSLVNVTVVCFVLSLPNVVALLSQVIHFQALASSDALTTGRGEESSCALCWVLQGCFPTEKLHWPWATLKPSAQALCSHESPAAASCSSVVRLGGMVYKRALCNSLAWQPWLFLCAVSLS